MKNNQTILFFVTLILAGFVLSCGMFGGSNSDGNSNANANTAANTTVNKRDPKKFCYFEGFSAGDGEYKSSGSGYPSGNHHCLSFKNGNLPSGRFQSVAYRADGDADSIEKVTLSMLTNTKYKDAGEGDDAFTQASSELWQRVFAAPLPNDIKETIMADKGKGVKMEKKFTGPSNVTVSREPGNGGTYYLRLVLTLPK